MNTLPGALPSAFEKKLSLPEFETSPSEVEASINELLGHSKEVIEKVAAQDLGAVSFASTVGTLDDLDFHENVVINRIHVLQNVSPDTELRKACEKAVLKFQEWMVERAHNKKLYQAVEAYAEKGEKLDPQDQKLLDEVLKDFHRAGTHLEDTKRERLQALQKEASQLETAFQININEHEDELWVTKEQLEGLEESFVKSLETNDKGEFKLTLEYPHYFPVLEFCKSEALRKELTVKKLNTAADKNVAILNKLLKLRNEMAHLLGYASWNHYIIDDRMAKTPARVEEFLTDLKARLKPKGEKELEELRKLKVKETGDEKAQVNVWDYRYYSSIYKREKFQIDTQEIKKYFPYEKVLKGMFDVYSKIFHIDFEELPEDSYYRWHDEVRLYKAIDKKDGDLGYFYMDMHPRAGKYGHACVIGITPGKFLPDGIYHRPVAVMLCNFPKPTAESPTLLPHDQVETLFHEFGHILHHILTTAKYSTFSGTRVARDFVEAPSQVLENWIWDYEVLKLFAEHYQKPGEHLSQEVVDRMNEADKAGSGLFYLRQLSFALADLHMHGPGDNKDADKICDEVFADVFLPSPEGTHFAAGWGHMVGYASGYYGYAWADVMAADMYSVFEEHGPFHSEMGRKLRSEIFEPGSSRDENASLEAFLSRPLSSDAFFQKLGA